MSLPVRAAAGSTLVVPATLDEQPAAAGEPLPQLRGSLPGPASEALELVLRIHNSAGIPIVEGRGSVAAGQTELLFHSLRPLGIEGYAHVNDQCRAEVAQRIWARRRYGTLSKVRGDF